MTFLQLVHSEVERFELSNWIHARHIKTANHYRSTAVYWCHYHISIPIHVDER